MRDQSRKKENIKVASFSVSDKTQKRLNSINNELFPQKNVSYVLGEIFKEVGSEFSSSLKGHQLNKFVTSIGSLQISSSDKRKWRGVVVKELGVNGELFLEFVDKLNLDYGDVLDFVFECRNITNKNRNIIDKNYKKKTKTFNTNNKIDNKISGLSKIVGENKSDTFQFGILTYSYLMQPQSRMKDALKIYDFHEQVECLLDKFSNEIDLEFRKLLKSIKSEELRTACERRLNNMDFVSLENAITECKIDSMIMKDELEPLTKQIDDLD
jgi:hypothetical protein